MSELLEEAVLVGRARRPAGGWRDAIRVACDPLVEREAVSEHYPQRCIEMVEEHGPYIVLAPGIALAHARPEDGALRLAVAATTLTEPVAFGHEDNDPVDLVFAFGSPDRDQHVGLLSALATALLGGLADRLRAAEDDEALQAALAEVGDGG
ncbi:PTS sugar transporter subunit IIA [Egicoccus sp. AB-alg2]|uniref:PTS sugar transporter subunit IIA n=1 Tax=Egicoccus sp. AB-alg2 TaxID=3242693 RepID=UPI00359DD1B6